MITVWINGVEVTFLESAGVEFSGAFKTTDWENVKTHDRVLIDAREHCGSWENLNA